MADETADSRKVALVRSHVNTIGDDSDLGEISFSPDMKRDYMGRCERRHKGGRRVCIGNGSRMAICAGGGGIGSLPGRRETEKRGEGRAYAGADMKGKDENESSAYGKGVPSSGGHSDPPRLPSRSKR